MTTHARTEHEISSLASEILESTESHRARAIAKVHAQRTARGDAEAHRKRGLARVKAATGGGATKVLRLQITNVLSGNDYSAQLMIGSEGIVANVILDTGSSTLAVDPSIYNGVGDTDLSPTTLIQLITYGTGGWAGPVVNTKLTLGTGANQVSLPNCPLAITSVQEAGNFQGVTGIMGLAYNGLNNAYDFSTYLKAEGKSSSFPWPFVKSWKTFLAGFRALLRQARPTKPDLKPYFDQVEQAGIVANKFAFYTLRSWVSVRSGTTTAKLTADPLNNGYLILGGGEEQTDLFTGTFSAVQVLHDLYYNVNLKSVRVDGSTAHPAAPLQSRYKSTQVSNAIVDSGTSDLTLAKDVFEAILEGFQKSNPAFIQAIEAAINSRAGVSTASLNLAEWPNIYFTLQGANGPDVELTCTPQTYWQTDFPSAGQAFFQISGPIDTPNQSILGLPLMNNYYTVFDRSQDVNGIINFATIKPPA